MFSYCAAEINKKDPRFKHWKHLMDQKVLIARARELTKGGHMCQGDSGSPLFVRKNNRFVQIGMNKHVFQSSIYWFVQEWRVLYPKLRTILNGRQVTAVGAKPHITTSMWWLTLTTSETSLEKTQTTYQCHECLPGPNRVALRVDKFYIIIYKDLDKQKLSFKLSKTSI